ncbi:hypothetical protein [Flexivirga oryzae]
MFSVWLLGTLFGAAFISLIAGILGGHGRLRPAGHRTSDAHNPHHWC